ncbi:ATP-binding protein [Ovoidimarina sediminis]|uniref:ATP-binding protein n=1 Tax=Ovoidimarina sediminis TaxID=3079856 RepID=UPI0029138D1A|nr:MoxR family ATPase [Rhodophyticola sp. MJ-SS7]MDU8944041.1 MoxR family ATPase [Rhodophyticola sp. MJ-SS7]
MTLNAETLSAGEAAWVLRAGWEAQVAGGLTASWMLHGRPGVGKTEIVAALADDIGARLFDLRLTTIEPQDLRGLPYYDHERGRTVWYRPEDLPDDPATPSILFLDELTAAAPHLQPTVYGLLQERRVGRHRLPQSVLIVAAGNSVEDGAVAYEMGTALSDRLIHLHVVAEARDWVENYAMPRGIDPAVVAFIRARPDLLETTEDSLRRGETIACTPRAWSRVSEIRRAVADRALARAMVAGTVGTAAAAEFQLVADDVSASLRVEEMLEAGAQDLPGLYPQTMHGLTALISALLAVASETTMERVIEVMAGIGQLAATREEAVFRTLPLAELQGFGFDMLIRKGLDQGLEAAFGRSEAYRAYAEARAAQGLD